MKNKKLNLGCGHVYKEGWINSDIGNKDYVGKPIKVDKVFNANDYPYPLKSNSFDEVLCEDLIQSIEDIESFLKELNRILIIKGVVNIRVSYFSYYGTYAELYPYKIYSKPIHRFCLNCNGLFFMFERNGFKLIEKKVWNTNKILRFFDKIINSSDKMQRIYERFFSNIFPVSHVKWRIEKVENA